ncbi:MAG: UDP-GlcNAc--UDP-phosphate GlcNAc-1-phosphate transferase [Cyclobacteriaceae bacterium]
MIFWLSYILVVILAELIYFNLARHYNIIDRPNERSSHHTPIIRGGGIIFIIGVWFWFFNTDQLLSFFVAGATLVALISLADDIKPRPAWIRFIIHFIAILLLFYQVQLYNWHWSLILLAGIVCIGTLNAFNFMDGINGITGIYAMVNLITFLILDKQVFDFTDSSLIIVILIANSVFLFFNFRKQARCFAGDVGSVTLAFTQIFFLLQIILATDSLLWVLLFFVFGIDSVITIIYRLKKKENIFKAHRTHLYQFLANELQWDHRLVALLYGLIQLFFNLLLIYFLTRGLFLMPLFGAVIISVLYITVREIVIRKIKVTPTSESN